MMKYLIGPIAVLLALFAFHFTLRTRYLAKHRPYFEHYQKLIKIYPEELVRKLGHMSEPEDRMNHFLNFKKVKDSDVFRVGVFGDSHTYGSEVDPEFSFAVELQRELERVLRRKVEVLNFGIGGGALQKSFILYQNLGKEFQLDLVLYGPRGVQAYRDQTFIPLNNPYSPKNRFILDNGKLREVDHPGIGLPLKEMYDPFLSFFLDRKLIAYERNWPLLWRPTFEKWGIKENPFYYWSNNESEDLLLNTQIFKVWKEKAENLIIFFDKQRKTYDRYKEHLKKEGIPLLLIPPMMEELPYRVTDHRSAYQTLKLAKDLVFELAKSNLLKVRVPMEPVGHLPHYKLAENYKGIKEAFEISNGKIYADQFFFGEIRRNGYEKNYKNQTTNIENGLILHKKGEPFWKGIILPLPRPLREKGNIRDSKDVIGNYIQIASNLWLGELIHIETLPEYYAFRALCSYTREGRDALVFEDFKLLGSWVKGRVMNYFIFDSVPVENILLFKGPRRREKEELPRVNDSIRLISGSDSIYMGELKVDEK